MSHINKLELSSGDAEDKICMEHLNKLDFCQRKKQLFTLYSFNLESILVFINKPRAHIYHYSILELLFMLRPRETRVIWFSRGRVNQHRVLIISTFNIIMILNLHFRLSKHKNKSVRKINKSSKHDKCSTYASICGKRSN